ncbi:MAG: hypothetical protein KC431_08345 [Myxococcales bacterium]|nr:hypothetical protein [Myxococcales bacterium]
MHRSTPIASRPSRLLAATLVATVMVGTVGMTTGCAGTSSMSGNGAGVDLHRPELAQFAVAGSMTTLERDVRIETSDREHEKLTPGLFWAGIGVGSFMAAGAIGFAAAGYATKTKLNDAYQDGSLTRPERDDLVSKGNLYNDLAVVGVTVAVISYALAIVTYGVDWNRCGPLAQKSKRGRHCEALPSR